MSVGKEHEVMFRLSAQLGSEYTSTFKSAQSSLVSMQKELQAVNKVQSDISAYEKQQGVVEATQKKLDSLAAEYESLQHTEELFKNSYVDDVSEMGQSSVDFTAKYEKLQQQIYKTAFELNDGTEKLDKMGSALNEAGVNTDHLANESQRLAVKLEETTQKQAEAADAASSYGTSASAAFDAAGQAIVAAGVAKALKEIAGYFAECVEESMEFESAMTGVAKTTDMTDAELAAMAEEFKRMSTVIPLAASEIAEIAEDAGQLGIAKNGILEFTEVMANLGVATNLSSTEAASQLAKFANITQMSAEYYENLGSTVVALGNNLATTEADIVNMAMRLAAAGEQAGMTEADIISISGALSSLGLESQAGGSAFSKVITQMQTAVETGSDSLEDFADVAGMSADEFSRAFKEDATSALTAFTRGLSDTERLGSSATVLLEEMGITELRMSDALKRAASSGDLFNEAIALGNAAWAENTALSKEAALRYGTTESKLTMMQNAYNKLRITIGNAFTPTLQKLYSAATDVMEPIDSFIQENPELISAVTAFVGIIGAATVVITAYVVIAKVAATANALFTATIPGVGVILGVVAAVAALTAGVVLLVGAFKKQYQEINGNKESFDELAASMEEGLKVEALLDEYKALRSALDDTTLSAEEQAEAEARLREVKILLAGASGGVITASVDQEEQFQKEADAIAYLNEQTLIASGLKIYDSLVEGSGDYARAVLSETSLLAKRDEAQQGWDNAYSVARMKEEDDAAQNLIGIYKDLNNLSQAEVDGISFFDTVEGNERLKEQLAEASKLYSEIYGGEHTFSTFAQLEDEVGDLTVSTADQLALMQAANDEVAKTEENLARNSEIQAAKIEEFASAIRLGAITYDQAADLLSEDFIGEANQAELVADAMGLIDEAIIKAAGSTEDADEVIGELVLTEEELAEAQRVLTAATGAVEGGFLTAERAAEYYGVSVDEINALMDENAAKASLIEMGLAGLEAGYWTMDEAAAALGIDVSELNQALNDQVYPEQIADMIGEIEALGEAYTAAYDAALSSIQGQYNLWDKAADVVAISAGEMTSAMRGQASYWENFDKNLNSLMERGADIEGFYEALAHAADNGSEEGVNAIAGLASGDHDALVAFTNEYKNLQTDQEGVANTLAQLATGFDEKVAEMQKELEDTVAAMDMSEDAAEQGRQTIEGFIVGAEGQLPAVIAAYTRIAQAAMEAIDTTLDINSPSREMEWRAEMTWAGYINQTEAMKEEVAAAMSGTVNAGTESIAAEQAYIVALAPQLMERLAAISGVDAISADPGSASGGYGDRQPVSVQLTIEIPSNATPETAEALRSSGEEIREIVRDVMEDIENDRNRRDFK